MKSNTNSCSHSNRHNNEKVLQQWARIQEICLLFKPDTSFLWDLAEGTQIHSPRRQNCHPPSQHLSQNSKARPSPPLPPPLHSCLMNYLWNSLDKKKTQRLDSEQLPTLLDSPVSYISEGVEECSQ
ncbi:hypothetical protein Y1Q_0001757 [Alligator mississippiensis]|uniref:Uncharacterized protein n=1 Tax=Alligator mississippiensis TaxID=8496 RepID=A0A151MKR5_ALLMI|nr:hypothetical protein Y1Q_0001757 [Alligator mississippiensis]